LRDAWRKKFAALICHSQQSFPTVPSTDPGCPRYQELLDDS
jgi:hypothetical protein